MTTPAIHQRIKAERVAGSASPEKFGTGAKPRSWNQKDTLPCLGTGAVQNDRTARAPASLRLRAVVCLRLFVSFAAQPLFSWRHRLSASPLFRSHTRSTAVTAALRIRQHRSHTCLLRVRCRLRGRVIARPHTVDPRTAPLPGLATRRAPTPARPTASRPRPFLPAHRPPIDRVACILCSAPTARRSRI